MDSSQTATDEMAQAERLPQADATSLIDADQLETAVKEMYRDVARGDDEALHFETGRELAEHLGYPPELLDRIPPDSLASFAGVGYHFGLAKLQPGERVLDLGSGSGTDVFCAAVEVGTDGKAIGIDFTDEQLAKARALAGDSFPQAEFVEGRIETLPFGDSSFDVVISNGVINLSLLKNRVFEEATRVLAPGGRLAISDIVSARALKERTRRNVELWAACIGGAIPRDAYLKAIEDPGLAVQEVNQNDYRFVTDRAQEACGTYGVESVSLLATKG